MGNPISISKLFRIASNKRVAIVILLSLLINFTYCQPGNTSIKGTLNLQNQSWAKDGIADLNGEWEFYWNSLYTPAAFDSAAIKPTVYTHVPGFWNRFIPDHSLLEPSFGYATYRLKVLCPPTSEKLALKFLTVASAYKLFINGKRVAEIGKVSINRETTTPAFQPVIVPVTPIDNELEIVIQVANFTYNTGGLWETIKLGTEEQIGNYNNKNIALAFFIAGSFFLIGIYYLVIYFFFNRRKSPLYFAFFCLLIGIRPLVTGELGINYITQWSWQLIKRTEFTTMYLTVPVLCLFSFELFPKEFSKKVLRCVLIISAPFVAAGLFTPPLFFRYSLIPFQLILLMTTFYGLYVYVAAVKYKRIGSIYLLAGFIFLFITVINDVLYSNLFIKSTNLFYTGLYIFILCQAITLSRQFFRAYIKIEKLNTKLEQINNELNVKNETINEANEQLSKLNAELDTLVFRTSHDLRSPITSMMTLAEVIKTEQDAGTRNEYLEFMKKTIRRLDNIITEILQYSKNKSTSLQYEKLDLQEFINNALQDHIFSYDSESIQRIVQVSQSDAFFTDKSRLGMIINNLISNGLKHHNKEQENPYLKIEAQVTKEKADIVVSDNGRGIEQEHLDNIFTKFYRGNTDSSGTGFGLYIVKEMVEKLGGHISVESAVNVGTSFHIIIPNNSGK